MPQATFSSGGADRKLPSFSEFIFRINSLRSSGQPEQSIRSPQPTHNVPALSFTGPIINQCSRYPAAVPQTNVLKRSNSQMEPKVFKKKRKVGKCKVEGCKKVSQRKGLCRSHGGGKDCMVEGCTKSVQRNNLCHRHGGIRGCQFPGCEKNNRGGGYCVMHGGGVRCEHPGCNSLARKKRRCGPHYRLLSEDQK